MLLAILVGVLWPMTASGRGIAPGPDGNIWFSDGARIARVTPAGVVTWFSAGVGGKADSIAAGPDGNMWFTEALDDRIGRITPDGIVTEFPAGTKALGGGGLGPITAGPDGNLWFIVTAHPRSWIARVTPAGVVTHFSAQLGGRRLLRDITAGPDGNVWFIDQLRGKIGRIDPAGGVVEFRAPVGAGEIVTGPDGRLWIASPGGLTRLTVGGLAERVLVPWSFDAPYGPSDIATGPDGNVWVTLSATDGRIARVTPTGSSTEFRAGISNFPTGEIIAGPDGNMWFRAQGRISRITRAGVVSEFPPTAEITSIRLSRGRTVRIRLRCPSGASSPCRGGLVVWGPRWHGEVRRFALGPRAQTDVDVPLRRHWSRVLRARGHVGLTAMIIPLAVEGSGRIPSGTVWRDADLRPPAWP